MINEESKVKLVNFLKEFPNPKIVVASTIIDGFVVCIKPVPTICGAELMCSDKTYDDVLKIVHGY